MKYWLLSAAVLATLTGCFATIGDSTSRAVQQHMHQVIPAAQLRVLRIENVSGTIDITGTNAPVATLDITKFAGHQDAIDDTEVVVSRSAEEVDAHTHYQSSGWFGNPRAGVDYKVSVPARVAIHVANVSGPVTIRGVSANVEIQEVSGAIDASLGRVGDERDIRINTVSGGTKLAVARNSDVTVDVKTVSGSVNGFFSMDVNKGFVGETAHGRIGNGSATINVNAVSGSVDVIPQ
ncbi:MAG TPA: DUF4097 family beta strand repeat-containing protein [Candidatus Baltobacteraceae bacterium]|jgi:hypothetical protein|nr:DUF4097 family beta strand repeat-containing protein [Candidatus Baltobacteraceae bacterium]